MKSKVSTRNAKVADFTHQQIRVAEVSAKLAAAEALLEKNIARLSSGEPIDTYEKLTLRRNYGYVARMCNEAVKAIVDHSGAGIVYEGNPIKSLLERCSSIIHALCFQLRYVRRNVW